MLVTSMDVDRRIWVQYALASSRSDPSRDVKFI
jgi:hypothetical protein